MNQLLGLQRSQFSNAGMGRQQIYASGSNASTSLDAQQKVIAAFATDADTWVRTSANEVAVIDQIDIMFVGSQNFGAADTIVTLTIGTQTMNFVCRALATQSRNNLLKLRPKGTIVVPPSTEFKISCNRSTFAGSAVVKYRFLNLNDAITHGFHKREFWCCSTGSIAVAGTAQNITGFTSADVGTSRFLEINGIVITGGMTNATSAANLEILLEFSNGTTHRKIIKGLYASAVPDVTSPTIINNCVIRGPVGYGLRVTAGQTGTGCQIALWGRYGSTDAKTFPGTGVAPGATDAFDAGEYFWLFNENTATGIYEMFPATTVAGKTDHFVIDGYAMAASGPELTGALMTISDVATAKNYGMTVVTPLSAAASTIGSQVSYVDDEANMVFPINGRVGLGVANVAGAASKMSQLVWGRVGGTLRQNTRSTTSTTKLYRGGSSV